MRLERELRAEETRTVGITPATLNHRARRYMVMVEGELHSHHAEGSYKSASGMFARQEQAQCHWTRQEPG